MTVIIGLVENDTLYMGGDSAVAWGWRKDVISDRKVFTNGPFLIGIAGYVRFANILRYQLAFDPQSEDLTDYEYMVRSFAEGVRKAGKELGYSRVKENEEQHGSMALIGYKQKLYELGSDFSILTNATGLMAIGVGEEFALGAMAAMPERKAETRILKALSIAGRYSMGIAEPYYVEVQKPGT